MESHPGASLIGIHGAWYDITNFVSQHPGGPLISLFVGKDATPVFKGLHTKDVLKYLWPVATFAPPMEDPASEAFAQLHRFFIQEGFFKTSALWYAAKFAFVLSWLLWAALLASSGSPSWYVSWLVGLCLALFWQQCGFLMHDFMHSQGFHERKIDNWIGLISGTLGVGVNSFWWQEEHFVHHALTNTVDYALGFYDPQMREDTWAQNEKLFPFVTKWLQRRMVSMQHWIFVPACLLLGRTFIIYDAFRAERRPVVWLMLGLHFCWLTALLCQLPTRGQALLAYAVASTFEGVLHMQLLVSHYCKPFYERRHVCEDVNWYRMQVESNINITNPVWMDWFHGGLNYHIEHHLYPLMPRHRYREASRHVKAVCAQLGIEYDECDWTRAFVRTLSQLKRMSVMFKLDPR